MGFQFTELVSKSFSATAYGIAGITATIVFIARLSRRPNLDAIPTVGSSSWLGSWWAGFKYLSNAADVVQEGYKKHKSAPFKIADHYRWTVIVSNREHIEELLRAPEEEISFVEGTNEQLNTRHIWGDEVHDKPVHLKAIRLCLTQNIETLYPEIRDEIVTAFDGILDLGGEEWKSVPGLRLIQQVVCRTSNRLFVGLPLCRDPDWIDLNTRYILDLAKAGIFLGLLPKFKRPLAACFMAGAATGVARGLKHIGPIVEDRLKNSNRYRDEKAEEPCRYWNDLISWLIEEAGSSKLAVDSIMTNILMVNFTAVHTASIGFTHALFYLAANPQYIQPLREEVESTVEKEGWSKAALSKMRKVDSFLKECLRVEGLIVAGLWRKALKDFTLSDGIFLPKGTLIGIATRSIHHDEKFYESANVFKPFRFAEMHGQDGDGAKNQFVSTTMEYLAFGHGKHACPGRFLATSELKTMLAHIVMTYDIKLEDNTERPHSWLFGLSILPNPYAKVLFRKRVD